MNVNRIKTACSLIVPAITAVSFSLTALAQEQLTAHTSENHDNNNSIETIVVTAEHMHYPGQIITDPKQPRQPLPASDGADYLKTIAGFNVIRKGGVSGDPVFRGMAASRLNIVNNGSMILGGCSSRMDPPTAYITPQNYDRIRIIKGPQSVLSLPANATVRFERDHQRQEQGLSGDIDVVAASFGRREITTDLTMASTLGFGRLTASKARGDNFKDGQGNEINSHYERQHLNAELTWTPTDHTMVTANIGRSEGHAAYADRTMDGSVFDRDHHSIKFSQQDITPWLKRVQASWFKNYIDHVMDNYRLRDFSPTMMMPNPAAMNPDRASTGGRIQFDLQPFSEWEVRLGTDKHDNRHTNRMSMNQTVMPYQQMARVEDGRFSQWSWFAESDYKLNENINWFAGLRQDHWQATDKRKMLMKTMMSTFANPTYGQSREDTLTSGFTRIEYALHHHNFYLGWGQATRFPDYWELIGKARGSELSTSSFNTAPEQTKQFDIGWLGKVDTLQWDLSVFYANIDDYILLDQQTNTGPETVRNIDATSWGAEASLSWWIAPHFKVQSTVAMSRGTNETDNKTLAQQAPAEFRLDLSYRLGNWQLGGLWRLVKAQKRLAIGQGNIVGLDSSPTAGFGIVSASVSRSIGEDWQVSAGIDNVFDKTYQEFLSRTASAIPGFVSDQKVNEPGRTIWLKVNIQF